MAPIDLEELNSDIAEYKEKHKNANLKNPAELNAYISDTDKILAKYPDLNSDPGGEAREILGKFCMIQGCWVIVFGNDLEHGVPYYHKAMELCPDSYDIHFDYFTTLEEIIANDKLRTPELVQDAIYCLQVCINNHDTPERKRTSYVAGSYVLLGKTYLIAEQPEKAIECANKSLEILDALYNKDARKLLSDAYAEQGKVYLAADQPEKAFECAKKAMKAYKSEDARRLLKDSGKRLGFFGRLRVLFRMWFKKRG